jgi:hypothetical protein
LAEALLHPLLVSTVMLGVEPQDILNLRGIVHHLDMAHHHRVMAALVIDVGEEAKDMDMDMEDLVREYGATIHRAGNEARQRMRNSLPATMANMYETVRSMYQYYA